MKHVTYEAQWDIHVDTRHVLACLEKDYICTVQYILQSRKHSHHIRLLPFCQILPFSKALIAEL